MIPESKNNSDYSHDLIEYLVRIIAIVTIIGFVLLYIYLDTTIDPVSVNGVGNTISVSARKLVLDMIPNFLASLAGFLVIYYVFVRYGISDQNQQKASDLRKLLEETVNLNSAPEVIKVYPNYRAVEWGKVLDEAESIDMAVLYFDSWIEEYAQELMRFFRRGGQLRVVLTSPEQEDAVKAAWVRFSKYKTFDEFKIRIVNTIRSFQQVLEQSDTVYGHIEAYYFNEALNYAIIRVDNSKLFLSNYEHFYEERIAAPSILIDLNKSSYIKGYWAKELGGLFDKSQKLNIQAYLLSIADH